jgi:Domain of unknown function (DUF4349)
MTHPESDSTATIERDLRAVDAALAGGTAAHDDPAARELQELALALRADAATPSDEFASALGERVEAGFPAKPGSARARVDGAQERLRGLRRTLPSPARLLPAAAAVVTVVLIGIAVSTLETTGPGGDDDDGGSGGGSVAQDSGGGGGAEAPGAGSAGAAPKADLAQPFEQSGRAGSGSTALRRALPPGASGFAPGTPRRRVERTISMTLEAPDEEIPRLGQEITRVTSRHGGFVLSSSLDSNDDEASGYYELRIPAARLRPALADLAGLATVSSQSQSEQDVTRRHVTVQDRLQAARAERRSLLRRLEEAETDEEAEAIRRRLDIVAGEINGLRGLLRDLRLRTNYAVVTVDLTGTGDESSGSGAGGSFDDALDDAGDLVVGLAGALIRIAAIAGPLALIAGLGWATARVLRRRRRESVLA